MQSTMLPGPTPQIDLSLQRPAAHHFYLATDIINSSAMGLQQARIVHVHVVISIFFLDWNVLVCLSILGNPENISFL